MVPLGPVKLAMSAAVNVAGIDGLVEGEPSLVEGVRGHPREGHTDYLRRPNQ